jgi:hypothetical protein
MEFKPSAYRLSAARHDRSPRITMEEVMRHILGALILILTAAPALAQTTTQIGRVTMVRTGWDADSFAVVTTSPLVNPGGCPTPDGYIAFQPQKGYTTYYAAALLAFELNVRVQVTVANTGCIAGRPKLIGINLLR